MSPRLSLSDSSTRAHSMNPNNSGGEDLSEHPLLVAMASGDMKFLKIWIASSADLNTPFK